MSLALTPITSMAKSNADSPWSVSGFGSITVGQLDTDKANFRGYTDTLTLKPDSLLGLQVSYDITPNLTATVQGTVKHDNKNYFDYNDDILNWAFLTWQTSDNLTLKAGRMRAPFLAYSDVNDIGYAYPWITLPKQSYSGWLFPTYDGVDALWEQNFDKFDTSLETYAGTFQKKKTVNDTSSDYRVNVFGGLIGKLNYNNFQFRLSEHRGEIQMDIADQLNMAQAYLESVIAQAAGAGQDTQQLESIANALTTQFSSKGVFNLAQASVAYDNLQYFTRAEWMHVSTNNLDFAPDDIDSYYLMGGYIVFPWTFSLTYSQSKITYSDKIETYRQISALDSFTSYFVDDSVRLWTLGSRWDVAPKIALKAEISLIDGYKDKNSYFTDIQDGFDRNAVLYKLSLQWVF